MVPLSNLQEQFSENASLSCSICFEIMKDPYMVDTNDECQHTYCRVCIDKHMKDPVSKTPNLCPECFGVINKIVKNRTAAKAIDALGKTFAGKEEVPESKPVQQASAPQDDSFFARAMDFLGIKSDGPINADEERRVNDAVASLLNLDEPKKQPAANVNLAPARNVEQAIDPEIKKAYSFIEALSQILDMDSAQKIARYADVPLEKRTDPETILKYIFELKYEKNIQSFHGILTNYCSDHCYTSKGDDFVSFLPELWEDMMGSKMQFCNRFGGVLPKIQNSGNAQPAANANPAPARNVGQAVAKLREMGPPVKASNAVAPQNQAVQESNRKKLDSFINEFSGHPTPDKLKTMCRLTGISAGVIDGLCEYRPEDTWEKDGPSPGHRVLNYIFECEKCNQDKEKFKNFISLLCANISPGILLPQFHNTWNETMS